MNIYIAPYKIGSESAKIIARQLGALRTKGNKSYRHPSIFINWGNSNLSVSGRGVKRIINKPRAVGLAANKIDTFDTFNRHRVPTVDWTQSTLLAKQWVEQDGVVYGRRIVNGSQGVGIIVITGDDSTFPHCPLYTKAVISPQEYRVHVANNKIIDFTRKRKRDGGEANEYIRNVENGWVFCRQEEELPREVASAALMGVAALDLDFGACDVLFKKETRTPYVLEINTSPGVEGTTLNKYVEYFKEIV